MPVFKGKGDPLNLNVYRGIKLLEHVFKLYKKVLDWCLRKVVDIDKVQYGFMPGRGTVDAVCSFIIKFIFCLFPSRICFGSTSNRRCEGWFINGVIVCRGYCVENH